MWEGSVAGVAGSGGGHGRDLGAAWQPPVYRTSRLSLVPPPTPLSPSSPSPLSPLWCGGVAAFPTLATHSRNFLPIERRGTTTPTTPRDPSSLPRESRRFPRDHFLLHSVPPVLTRGRKDGIFLRGLARGWLIPVRGIIIFSPFPSLFSALFFLSLWE